uniref:Uncharacterized protein n=1 Tax=Quercus lobata TaxID=97700 RepID=A0A7N2M368_QUELO
MDYSDAGAECEIEALGGCEGSNPEQTSAQLARLNQRLQHESQRYSESIDDLLMLYKKKGLKISEIKKTYKAFLIDCMLVRLHVLRRVKFDWNASFFQHRVGFGSMNCNDHSIIKIIYH